MFVGLFVFFVYVCDIFLFKFCKIVFVKISFICKNMVVICMYFVRFIIVKNRFIFEVSCRNKVLIINLFD